MNQKADLSLLSRTFLNSPSLLGMTPLQITAEKRRKRRESHNLVERRRRDNINDRITELASLLPECLLEQANSVGEDEEEVEGIMSPVLGTSGLPNLSGEPSSLTSNSTTTFLSLSLANGGNGPLPSSLAPQPSSSSNTATNAAVVKPNKGIILSKSVEYIKYLQQLVGLYQTRNEELERVINHHHNQDSGSPSLNSHSNALGLGHHHPYQSQVDESTPEEIEHRRLYFASLSSNSHAHNSTIGHEVESTIGKSESLSPDDWTRRGSGQFDEMGGMGLEGMEMEE